MAHDAGFGMRKRVHSEVPDIDGGQGCLLDTEGLRRVELRSGDTPLRLAMGSHVPARHLSHN